MKIAKLFTLIAIVLLALFVALSPTVVYAQTPKLILYFLISFLPAMLFGTEIASRFELKLPGFCFTTAGAFAACLGTLLVLTQLSKPEQMIAVYSILDEHGEPVNLERAGALLLKTSIGGLSVTKFVEGNSVVLIFPTQIGDVSATVTPISSGPRYSGTITYAGSRSAELKLGQDFKKVN